MDKAKTKKEALEKAKQIIEKQDELIQVQRKVIGRIFRGWERCIDDLYFIGLLGILEFILGILLGLSLAKIY